MSVLAEYQAIMARLDNAIDNALSEDVADAVRAEMNEQVHKRVYDAYVPQNPSARRMDTGGLSDTANYDAHLEEGHVLVMENNTPMQNPNGANLVEIVEEGNEAYHMPFARPFVEMTEKSVNAGWALAQGLRKNGFSVQHTRKN